MFISFTHKNFYNQRNSILSLSRWYLNKVEKIPKEYYDYFADLYSKSALVKAAVDIAVENIVGEGFEFVAREGADEEKTKEMIKVLEEFSEKVKFPRLLYKIATDMLVFGNSFTEIVIVKGEGIVDLKTHDPRTIAIVTNGKNKLRGYAKIEDDNITKRFNKDEIMHIKNPLGKGWYGRSQIELLLPKLKEKFRLQEMPSI